MSRYLTVILFLAGAVSPASGRAATASQSFFRVWDTTSLHIPIASATALAWDETGKFLYIGYAGTGCGVGLAKMTVAGTLVWNYNLTGNCTTENYQINDIALDADGTAYLACKKTTATSPIMAADFVVKQILPGGTAGWTHVETGTGLNSANAVALRGLDLYYGGARNNSFFLARAHKEDGVLHWSVTTLGNVPNVDETPLVDLAVDDSGSVYTVNKYPPYAQLAKWNGAMTGSNNGLLVRNGSSYAFTEKARLVVFNGPQGLRLLASAGQTVFKVNPADCTFPPGTISASGQVMDMAVDPAGNLVYGWQTSAGTGPTMPGATTTTTITAGVNRNTCVETDSLSLGMCNPSIASLSAVTAVAAGTVGGVDYIFVAGTSDGVQALGRVAVVNPPAAGSIQIRNNVIRVREGGKAQILIKAAGPGSVALRVFTASGAYVGNISADNIDATDGLVEFDGKMGGKALKHGVYWIAASGAVKDRKQVMVFNK